MLNNIIVSKVADELTERKQRKTLQITLQTLVSKMADKLTERKQRKTRQMLSKILVKKWAVNLTANRREVPEHWQGEMRFSTASPSWQMRQKMPEEF